MLSYTYTHLNFNTTIRNIPAKAGIGSAIKTASKNALSALIVDSVGFTTFDFIRNRINEAVNIINESNEKLKIDYVN